MAGKDDRSEGGGCYVPSLGAKHLPVLNRYIVAIGLSPAHRLLMRSSTGQHFVALDHIRALAAFLVVCWHFTHSLNGFPVPFGTAPELAFFDEGHVGVSLFMTLSGYLFAKLLDGKEISLLPFLWNRFLRLMPLLALVLLIVGLQFHFQGGDATLFLRGVSAGLVLPVLPNGGWSITAELHFYLILPILLLLLRKKPQGLLMLVGVAISIRVALYLSGADVQFLAYRTIIGRFDQFVFGMLLFHHRGLVSNGFATFVALLFAISYAAFDLAGGYYNLPQEAKFVWIVLPTWEAACLGALIAWYDGHALRVPFLAWPMQKAGEYSYSIYLLHFFFYEQAARVVHTYIMPISSIYLALPWAMIFFVLMAFLGHFSFRYIERPMLAFRRSYVLTDQRDQGRACSGPAAKIGASAVPAALSPPENLGFKLAALPSPAPRSDFHPNRTLSVQL